MSGPLDEDPPRLSASGSAEARELLRAAQHDAPDRAARQAGVARVLSSYRERQQLARWCVAAAMLIGFGVGYTTFARPRGVAVTPLAREPRVLSSASAGNLALPRAPSPAPSSSVPVASAEELEPCAPAARSAGDAPMIDDFEDGDGRTLRIDRRAGSWTTFNDSTGVQNPMMGILLHADRIPGGRGASHFGLHTSGSKFTKWGASLATELSPRRCYDASAYAGISFWSRGHGKINFVVKMTQVVGEEFGGSCLHDCYDGHRVSIGLTSTWELHRVRWEELTQAGFGSAVPFDPRSLFSLEFQVLIQDTPFDLWVDDVSFIER